MKRLERDLKYVEECFDRIKRAISHCDGRTDYWDARQAIESLSTAVSRLGHQLGIEEGCRFHQPPPSDL